MMDSTYETQNKPSMTPSTNSLLHPLQLPSPPPSPPSPLTTSTEPPTSISTSLPISRKRKFTFLNLPECEYLTSPAILDIFEGSNAPTGDGLVILWALFLQYVTPPNTDIIFSVIDRTGVEKVIALDMPPEGDGVPTLVEVEEHNRAAREVYLWTGIVYDTPILNTPAQVYLFVHGETSPTPGQVSLYCWHPEINSKLGMQLPMLLQYIFSQNPQDPKTSPKMIKFLAPQLGKLIVARQSSEPTSSCQSAPSASVSGAVATPQSLVTASLTTPSFFARHLSSISSETCIPVNHIEAIFPCTGVQEGMLAEFYHSETSYMYEMFFELCPQVDAARLKYAWSQAMEAHEILRMGFCEVEDDRFTFAMIVYKQDTLPVPWFEMHADGQSTGAGTDILGKRMHLPQWEVRLHEHVDGDGVNVVAGRKLVLKIHHAIFDGFSLMALLQDVEAFYKSTPRSPSPQFPVILEKLLDAPLNANAKKFWVRTAEGLGREYVVPRFPDLNPVEVPDKNTFHVLVRKATVPLGKIQGEAKRLGFRMQNLGQAAWAKVLAKYTGSDGGVFGLVLSGRTKFPESAGVVFPCVATLPFTFKITGTNRDLVNAISTSSYELLTYQHTPLRNIMAWTENKLVFDTVFVYQQMPLWTDMSIWTIEHYLSSIKYSVTFEMVPMEHEKKLWLRLICANNIVPKEHTDLLLQQIEAALINILFNPDGPATAIPNIPATALSHLPAASPLLPGKFTPLHQFVEHQAIINPEKSALEFVYSLSPTPRQRTWSYTELDREANRVANFLASNGLKKNDIVVVSLSKSPEVSWLLLGILKAGGVFLCMDPDLPVDRKEFVIKDSKATLFLSNEDGLRMLEGKAKGVKMFTLGDISGFMDPSAFSYFAGSLNIAGEDACYCLYTSGSTGTPKGCLITHSNAVQAMYAFSILFSGRWDGNSRFLQFASYHFDVSVLEQFWSWLVGICVVATFREVLFQDLPGVINALNITHLDLTPSLAVLLQPQQVPHLCKGIFITGGETLKKDILEIWGDKAVIHNGYGPTEVTIGCTMNPRVLRNGKPSNIGRQFENVSSYVWREGTQELVPRGTAGELCVGGALVGKGYLNREELNREKFLTVNGERVYRTGDIVRMLADGSFLFCGRADGQVKLRGQRLETGEIDQVLVKNSPQIESAITVALKHPTQGGMHLISFVVSRDWKNPKLEEVAPATDPVITAQRELVEACKAKLPKYMIPSMIIPLTRLPLTSNNKVDNKRLTLLYTDEVNARYKTSTVMTVTNATMPTVGNTASTITTQTAYTSSTSSTRTHKYGNCAWTQAEIEHQIIKAIAEVGKTDASSIDRNTSLFELGIDSVSSIGIASRLRKRGLLGTSATHLMRNPTVVGISKALLQLQAENNASSSSSVSELLSKFSANKSNALTQAKLCAAEVETFLPCTPLQEGMISQYLRDPNAPYFNTIILRLAPTVQLRRLRNSWEDVVQANDVLRTAFAPTADGYASIVLKHWEPEWEEVYGDESLLMDRVAAFKHRNANLHRPPIFFVLLRGQEAKYLGITMFHAIYDGVSVPLLIAAAENAYLGKGVHFSNFSKFVTYILATNREKSREFWKTALAGVKPQIFNSNTAPTEPVLVEIKATLKSTTLEMMSKAYNCTNQAILQTCWALILSVWLESSSVCFGMIVSGRHLPIDDVESTIGPLFNTLPCAVDIANGGDMGLDKLVAHFHHFNQMSLPFHHTALRDICRDVGHKKLFDTLFVFQKFSEVVRKKEDESIWKVERAYSSHDYPVALQAEHDGDQLNLLLRTDSNIVSRDDAQRILMAFKAALSFITIHELSTPAAEVQQWLAAMLQGSRYTSSSRQMQAPAFNPASRPKMQKSKTSPALLKDLPPGGAATTKAICTEIAALANIHVDDLKDDMSLFEAGLDSIDAIKLSARLKSSHNIDLSVPTIMRGPTISQMIHSLGFEGSSSILTTGVTSHSLQESRLMKGFSQVVREKLGLTSTIYPATPFQEGIIYETIVSKGHRYFVHAAIELSPNISIPSLKATWARIVEDNDIFRTVFYPLAGIQFKDGQQHHYAQVVKDDAQLQWDEHHSVDSRLQAVIEQVGGRARLRIDIQSRPLYEVNIIQTPSRSIMVLSISHALYDGWALGLLVKDLLFGLANGGMVPPRPQPRNLIEEIISKDTRRSLEFWAGRLQGHVFQPFPVGGGGTVRKAISSRLTHSIVRGACRKIGVTVQTVGQLCWGLQLARHLRRKDVLFGVVLLGRDTQTSMDTIFPTITTVPVRIDLSHRMTYKALLLHIQDEMGELYAHRNTPLQTIQKAISSGKQIFDTLFLFQEGNQRGDIRAIEGQDDWKVMASNSSVEYAVSIELERKGDNFLWRTACENTVCENEAEALLRNLDRLFEEIILDANKEVEIETEFDHDSISMSRITTPKTPESDVWKRTELTICNVLADCTHTAVDKIYPGTTIFEVGLDSIGAIHFSSRLWHSGIKLDVAAIMRAQTVEKMVETAIGSMQIAFSVPVAEMSDIAGYRAEVAGSIPLDMYEDVLPATPGQAFLLSTWQKSGRRAFHSVFAFRLNEIVDTTVFRAAFIAWVAGNPILRTSFATTTSKVFPLVQIVHKPDPRISPPLQFTSESHTCPESKSIIQAAIMKLQSEKWIMSQPPLQAHLVTFASTSVFLLRLHHVLYDAYSLPLLLAEFGHLYRQACRSELTAYSSSLLPIINPQRQAWETHFSKPYTDPSLKSFWKATLATATSTLVQEASVNAVTTSSEVMHKFFRTKTDVAAVRRRCTVNHVSLQAFLLCAYGRAHAHIFALNQEKPEVIIGIYYANRHLSGSDAILAPLLNFVPVRVGIRGRNLWDDARNVQNYLINISSTSNTTVGLKQIAEWTGVEVDTFVNFIPAATSPAQSSFQNLLELTELGGHWMNAASGASASIDSDDETRMRDLLSDRLRELRSMLDVQMSTSVTESGGLSIGVVSTAAICNERMAGSLVHEMASVIQVACS